MHHFKTWASVLAAGLLFSACSSDSEGEPVPPPSDPKATVTLTGVVAKGTLRNAIVKAHPVNATGAVDTTTTLAETLSNDSGAYTLNFSATVNAPYVIRVSARPAGQTPPTTQLDEISGATDVPANFSMRALFVPATSGNLSTSASVTPFSELAVAAAEKGSGGITAGNASQGRANVAALIGFDPTTVTPTTIAGATGPTGNTQQLVLATLLTAVSRLANDSGIGCAQATLAERTACVVSTLGTSATLASTNPGTVAGTNVAAALLAATQAVVAANNVPPSALGIVIDNLQGPGTPPQANVPLDTQAGIAAAKDLFNTLRSDWQSLFGGQSQSPAALEADKFRAAMEGVQAPADVLLKDAGALLTGIDLYRDYLAGRTTVPTRGRADAVDFVDGANFNSAGVGRTATGCTLYTDSTNTVRATTVAEAQSIGCQALYYMTRQNISGGYQVVYWRHGFTIAPPASGSSTYTYTTRARRSVDACMPTCVRTVNDALQANFYAGNITVGGDANGHITSFSIDGELPGAFASGGTSLVNERHSWVVNGSRSLGAGPGYQSSVVTATIIAYAAASSTPVGTLKLTEGKLADEAVSRTASGAIVRRGHPSAVSDAGGELGTGDLPLEWTTPTASFKGRLLMADSVWDSSGTAHLPTRIELSGQFLNINGAGVASEFLSGSISTTVTGFAAYDARLDPSASNRVTLGLQFSGSVSAPGRPVLALTLGTTTTNDQEELASMTLQYRSLVAGTAKQTINITATNPPTGLGTLLVSEVASNVSMQYTQEAATATIRRGTTGNGTELGTLTTSTSRVTFVDGTTMSLDTGL